MIRLNQIKLGIEHLDIKESSKDNIVEVLNNNQALNKKIKDIIKTSSFQINRLVKLSLDARDKNKLQYILALDIKADSENYILSKSGNNNNIMSTNDIIYKLPNFDFSEKEIISPVIIGSGPAGYFAGLYLARMGLKPIIMERGKSVDERTKDVESFWDGNAINPESNVSFGEGGAGTFSDGKLNTGVKDIPAQWSRKQIFEFAENELKDIQKDLKAPGENVYARVDCVADWFLLSRMYLNAKTWIGEDRYDDALTYAKKVIEDGHYPLASDYRHIFLADNDQCKEIIWPLVQDGLKAQSSGGTNFYVKAFVNGPMDELYNTGIGSRGWGNVRSKTTLVDAFDPADVMFDVNDPWGNNKNDKRAQFMTALPNQVKETWDSKDAMTSTYTCGYGYIKWRNVTKDDQIPASGDAYTSIDFPLFRTGEAYLTAAEAILRGAKGSKAEALKYVNEIRERAYMSGKYAKAGVRSDVSGDIEESELTLDFIMAERQRELASELVRRTDLIRFGKYTKGHNWDWKNGERLGTDVDDHFQLFPIPQTEFSNNPKLKQNAGYAN